MYTRRKQNRSGSTSVYIVKKEKGKQVFIKSMGVGMEEHEIRQLEQQAQGEIKTLTGQTELQLDYRTDRQHLEQLSNSISSIRIVGTELVLIKIFNEIGFDRMLLKLIFNLGDPFGEVKRNINLNWYGRKRYKFVILKEKP